MDYELAEVLVKSFSFCLLLFVCSLVLEPSLYEELMIFLKQVRLGVRRTWWIACNHPELPWVRVMISWRAHRIADELLKEAERLRNQKQEQ